MSYQELDLLLRSKSGEEVESRKLGNNTYGIRRDNGIAVRLHNTDVVTWHSDETVTLNTGGWYSVTTKDRINKWAAPFSVYSVGGTWHVLVKNPSYVHVPWGEEPTGPAQPYHLKVGAFYDGIKLDAKDPTAVLVEPAEVQVLRERDAATKRAVKRYVDQITDDSLRTLIDHARSNGTGGDCWLCMWPGRETEADHLETHLEEGYHFVTLYLNALKAAGYRSPTAVIGAASCVKRAVRRYLLASLLVGPTAGRRGEPDALATGF